MGAPTSSGWAALPARRVLCLPQMASANHFSEFCMTDANEGGVRGNYNNVTDALDLAAGGHLFLLADHGRHSGAGKRVGWGRKQGNRNVRYYALAEWNMGRRAVPPANSSLGAGVASSCVFYYVTLGDMDVNRTGTDDCFGSVGTTTYGALSPSDSNSLPLTAPTRDGIMPPA